MRGKSPNWLLGVLLPTTYILGGENEQSANNDNFNDYANGGIFSAFVWWGCFYSG